MRRCIMGCVTGDRGGSAPLGPGPGVGQAELGEGGGDARAQDHARSCKREALQRQEAAEKNRQNFQAPNGSASVPISKSLDSSRRQLWGQKKQRKSHDSCLNKTIGSHRRVEVRQ